MEYFKYHGRKKSISLDQEVDVLEYRENGNAEHTYTECDCCGKPIKRRMFVLQDPETDVEVAYLGSECLKKYI